jgi:hypothetical protein
MSLPWRILAALALLAAAFVTGWTGHARWRAADDARQALQQSEDARESERLAQRNMTRIHDALTQDRLRSDRAAADAAGRLRQLAAGASAPAGCPGRNDDPRAAAAVLHDAALDDLVALARDADAVADRLRACQAALSGR